MEKNWHWVEEGVHATCYCPHCGSVTSWRLTKIVKDTHGNMTAEGIFSCICCGKEKTQKEASQWNSQS